MSSSYRLIKWLVILLTLLTTTCLAANNTKQSIKNTSAQKAELSQITSQIKKLQTSIQSTRVQRSLLEKRLRSSETQLAQLGTNIERLDTTIRSLSQQLQDLKQQQDQYQQNLETQQQTLAAEIRAAYYFGNQPFIRVLLNQQDPSKLGRILQYYRYFNQARAATIADLQQTLMRITHTQTEIQQKTKSLKITRGKQEQTLTKIAEVSVERKQVLNELNSELSSKSERLRDLKINKKALEDLVKRLEEQTRINAMAQKEFENQAAFADSKGKLPWPVRGKILKTFNSPIDQGAMKYAGVFISAPMGTPIHAIAPGRVIFSDWLKGYGFLMIIDQGKGYLTLYAHNNELYQKVGAKVSAGQVIATVGNSGGFQKTGLYFEIRGNGIPLNPQHWCRSNN